MLLMEVHHRKVSHALAREGQWPMKITHMGTLMPEILPLGG